MAATMAKQQNRATMIGVYELESTAIVTTSIKFMNMTTIVNGSTEEPSEVCGSTRAGTFCRLKPDHMGSHHDGVTYWN